MGPLQLSVKIWQKEKYPRLSLFDNSLFSQVDWTAAGTFTKGVHFSGTPCKLYLMGQLMYLVLLHASPLPQVTASWKDCQITRNYQANMPSYRPKDLVNILIKSNFLDT